MPAIYLRLKAGGGVAFSCSYGDVYVVENRVNAGQQFRLYNANGRFRREIDGGSVAEVSTWADNGDPWVVVR